MTPQTVSSRLWRQSEALGRPGEPWNSFGRVGGKLWEAKGAPRGRGEGSGRPKDDHGESKGFPKRAKSSSRLNYINKLPINRTRGRYVIYMNIRTYL